MTVNIIGWTDHDAVALVDGIRCRIRRNTTATRWLCDAHPDEFCAHLEALNAAQPFPADKRNNHNRKALRCARQGATT